MKPSLVFSLAFVLYGLVVAAGLGRTVTGNEMSHVLLVGSLTAAGSVQLETVASPDLLAVADVSRHDGQAYSNKPPGLALLVWPVAQIMTGFEADADTPIQQFMLAILLFNTVLAALTVLLIRAYLASFRLSPWAVGFGVLAASVGTLAPIYVTQATTAAVTLFLTVAVLVCLRRYQLKRSMVPLILSPALMALAFAADYKIAAFLLPAAVYAAWALCRTDIRSILAAGVLVVIPLAALGIYHHAAFGEVLTFSYSHYEARDYVPWEGVGGAFSLSYLPDAAWGLTLGTARGMVPISPVVALGIAGLVVAWRRGVAGLRLPMLMAGAGFLSICCYLYWFGGHSVGYRHVMVTAVLLAMMSAFAVDAMARHRAALSGCALVLLVSAVFAYGGWRVQMDPVLLDATWREEEGRVQGDFFADLLIPCFTRQDVCAGR